MAAPLKLKRQSSPKVVRQDLSVAQELPIAAVLVDTPVSHLEGVYDYLVPESLHASATIGTKAIVEFGNTTTEGLIVARKKSSDKQKNMKTITRLNSPSGLVSLSVIKHIEAVRDRFGGGIWNIIKSAIPARVIKEESFQRSSASSTNFPEYDSPRLRELVGRADYDQIRNSKKIKWALSFPIGIKPELFLTEFIKVRAQINQVLLIVPDEKDLTNYLAQLSKYFGDEVIELGSHLSKNLRYRNYLKATFQSKRVIIASRSGAFTELESNSTVIVLSDLDESHYEQHAPGWNTRDVCLLRDSSTSIVFASVSHSLEIARLVEIGWLESKIYENKSAIKIVSANDNHSSILTIKKGLDQGNVLVSVSEKGYANLFLCTKCRNTANCECGGKLQIAAQPRIPSCYLCQKIYKNWQCIYCGDSRPFVIARGIDRTAEEIGRALPKKSILVSSGNKQLRNLPKGNHVVIATAGSEPNETFASVVMLDGEKIFNRPSLRAEEMAKFSWFNLLSKAKPSSEVFLSLPNHHPAVQAILRGQSRHGVSEDLINREKAKLPPFYRIAVVIGEKSEISKFSENLKSSYSFEVTGPTSINGMQSKLLIRATLQQGSMLVDLLDDITKIQGVKGRKIFNIRFDPFDL